MLDQHAYQKAPHGRRPLGVLPTCIPRPHTQPVAAVDRATDECRVQDRQLFHLTRTAVEDLMKFTFKKSVSKNSSATNSDTSAKSNIFLPSLQNNVTDISGVEFCSHAAFTPPSSTFSSSQPIHQICHNYPGSYIVTQTQNELPTSKETTLPALTKNNKTAPFGLRKPKPNPTRSRSRHKKRKHQQPTKLPHNDNSSKLDNQNLVEETVIWKDDDDDNAVVFESSPSSDFANYDSAKNKPAINDEFEDASDSLTCNCEYSTSNHHKHKLLRAILDEADERRDSSSPVVSDNSDILCDESQHQLIFPPNSTACDQAATYPSYTADIYNDFDWTESESKLTSSILDADKPAVPHVIWPKNKHYTSRTIFIYGSPSQTAPVVVPTHSVDCPMCQVFEPTRSGDTCPPNSPTPMMKKTFGFYPVERNSSAKSISKYAKWRDYPHCSNA